MPVDITYMGTKRELADRVATVAQSCRGGALLDAFSGMCAVAESVSPERQIWTNDIQIFASEVARALFTSSDFPPLREKAASTFLELFTEHSRRLRKKFGSSLKMESYALESGKFGEINKDHISGLSDYEMRLKALSRKAKNYNNFDLFSSYYSKSYWGIAQCVEIDSIVYAIDKSSAMDSISIDEKRWCLIALARALLLTANTTGHLAQYLDPKPSIRNKLIRLRTRSIWEEFLTNLGRLSPAGSAKWRTKNRVYNEDSAALLERSIGDKNFRPGIIYADPPYTKNQYSRYYHVFETLFLYDYPSLTGKGRYRPDRYLTPFSQISKVSDAFDKFIYLSKKTGANLILSYPANGLLHKAGGDPYIILKKYYKKVEICYEISTSHSTLGASNGDAKTPVVETIYLAKTN